MARNSSNLLRMIKLSDTNTHMNTRERVSLVFFIFQIYSIYTP